MSSSEPATEEFLDLRQLIDKLWTRRWWLVASTLLFAVASVVFALSSERIYRATAILAPAASGGGSGALGSMLGQMGGLASLAGINLGSGAPDTEEALAVLRSRDFTVRFFATAEALPQLFPENWDAHAKQWKPGVKAPSVSRAFARFDDEVRTIIQNRKTGLISLQIDLADRKAAARWANELAARLNEEMRVRAITEANNSLQYLQKELESTVDVATRESINRLIESQVKQRMLANVSKEYAFRVIDRAVEPEPDEAVKPRRTRIVLFGVALGFLLGALLIVTIDYFRRGRP